MAFQPDVLSGDRPPSAPIAHVLIREAKGIRPGGFGLVSAQASVDELLYNEKRNEVVFVKYLDGGEPTTGVPDSPTR